MKKRHLTLSVLIHTAIIFLVVLISSTLMVGNKSQSPNALMVTVSGDPNLPIGNGKGIKKETTLNKTNTQLSNMGLQNTIVSESSSGASGLGGGTGNEKTSYTGSILQKIQEYKYYPLSAKKNKLTGVTKLKFTVLSNGTIKNDIQILTSSKQELLDQAAIKIIKNAAPFAAFPQNIQEKELSMNVTIDFTLQN